MKKCTHYKDDWYRVGTQLYINPKERTATADPGLYLGIVHCPDELVNLVKESKEYKRYQKVEQFRKELAKVLKC